mmetsp:Transcript_16816/g.55003  ORF Transcript_16816/g.55003 Transcript_16816/m.55003 type:complete len:194 (+) Transcript_16816:11-592(+)
MAPSSTISALRSNGPRKHLDLLLLDLHEENKALARGEPRPVPGKKTMVGGTLDEEVEIPRDHPDYWNPPYVHKGAAARELSSMVNARRTPSGNFFQITNPSLWVERVASTKPELKEYEMKAKEVFMGTTHILPTGTQKTVKGEEGDVEPEPEPPAGPKPWITPAAMCDRVEGKKVAKMVSNKRTPTGGFFNQA